MGFSAARAVLSSSVLASDLKSPKPVLEEMLPSMVQAAGFLSRQGLANTLFSYSTET